MRRKKFLFASLAAVLIVILCAGAVSAATGTSTLKAVFKNIKIIVDGTEAKVADGEPEPFIVGNRVFVPLRMVGEALGANVHWDSAENKVIISTNAAEIEALQQQVIERQTRINELERQVTELKDQISSLQAELDKEKEKNKDSDLSDLKDKLLDKFGKLEDVKIRSLTLSGDKKKLTVKIKVDLGKDDDEWEELRDRDIKDWLEDFIQYIHDKLDEDCYVRGTIIDDDSGDKLVEFEKDGEDEDLEVDYFDEDYR
ncbi:MAG: hypothetical protein GX088_07440 [Clostridia bacterium]|nr:hypothetical protein [Clostridia bacterium]